MSKKQIFTFLRDLTANKSKEWMDAKKGLPFSSVIEQLSYAGCGI